MESFCFKFNSLHLRIDETNGKIIVEKCCLKSWNRNAILKEYSFTEFLEIEDVYSELSSLINVFPKDFPTDRAPLCPENVISCDWRPFKCSLKSIEVALDNHCNAKCRFCHLENDRNQYIKKLGLWEKTKDAYFNVLESIKGHQLDIIRLTDTGEPFFWKRDILNYIKSLSRDDTFRVECNTNLISLTEIELRSLLEESQVEIFMIVSLNAWDESSYSEIMGVRKELFYKVLANIKILKEKNIKFFTSFVIDRKENVEKIWKFCKENSDILGNLIINPSDNNEEIQIEIDKFFPFNSSGVRSPRIN